MSQMHACSSSLTVYFVCVSDCFLLNQVERQLCSTINDPYCWKLASVNSSKILSNFGYDSIILHEIVSLTFWMHFLFCSSRQLTCVLLLQAQASAVPASLTWLVRDEGHKYLDLFTIYRGRVVPYQEICKIYVCYWESLWLVLSQ